MTVSFNAIIGRGVHSADARLFRYLPLQETTGTVASDASGNLRDGTIVNMGANPVVGAGPNGYLPSAYEFNGSSHRISMTATVDATPRTICAWQRTTATSRGDLYSSGSAAGAADYLRLAANENSTGVVGANARFQNNTVEGAVSSNVSCNDGNWRHIAATYTTAQMRLFVNGAPVATAAPAAGAINFVSDRQSIGVLNRGISFSLYYAGRIAGVADFSAVLTDAEIAEIAAGPEPINVIPPAMPSGTPADGRTLTSFAGTWDSQSNGVITYARQWTRSNDASGTGEVDIAGATGITYTITSADVGKYIRYRIRASNLGGFDPAADVWSPFTAVITPRTSYNSLVGILASGVGGGDEALQSHYLLQETAGTSFADRSGNGRHGTAVNMGSDPVTTAGPTGWLPSAVVFGGGTQHILLPDSVLPTADLPVTVYVRAMTTASVHSYAFGTTSDTGRVALGQFPGPLTIYSVGDQANLSRGSHALNSWLQLAIAYAGGVNGHAALHRNGAVLSPMTVTAKTNAASPRIGGFAAGGGFGWVGPIAEVATFSRALLDNEILELNDGPEPVNLTLPAAPSGDTIVGRTLTANTGTWDNQNNGAVSYEYQWTRSDDINGTGEVLISGATAATYVLVVADVDKYIRCRVRALNSGGFDPTQEVASAFTARVRLITYNALVGVLANGVGGGDAALSGHWLLQETVGTSFQDRSGSGNTGTSANMGANPTTTGGPGGWLPSAVVFTGGNARISLPGVVLPAAEAPLGVFVRCKPETPVLTSYAFGASSTNNGRIYLGATAALVSTWSAGNLSNQTRGSLANNVWTTLAMSFAGGPNGVATPYINGTAQATLNTTSKGLTIAPTIGGLSNDSGWVGAIAEVATFHRALTTGEVIELTGGPEPISITPPTTPTGSTVVNATLTASTGVWDSQNNGTLSFSYQWTRSLDNTGTGEMAIAGATAAIYTLTDDDAGKYIRCRVRASNSGGFDQLQDTVSAFTAAIAETDLFADLISVWELDELSGNAIDSHGTNTLTPFGSPAAAAGVVGGARNIARGFAQGFSGSNNPTLQLGDIDATWCCWVRLASKPGNMAVFSKWNFGVAQREYHLQFSSSLDRFRFIVTADGATQVGVSADSLGSPALSTWYWVVCGHAASTNQLFIQVNNGTRATVSYSAGVLVGSSNFCLGRLDGGSDSLDGSVDQVLFYKRLLNPAELTMLYNSGSGRAYGSFGDDGGGSVPQPRRRRSVVGGFGL